MMNDTSYNIQFYAQTDTGKRREHNQDQVICCPEYGFFAVCDGMGGLPGGGDTSKMIATVLPKMIAESYKQLADSCSHKTITETLKATIGMISDQIFSTANTESILFGSTLCGVWVIHGTAYFVNIGDSRAYYLPRYKHVLRQISEDHNIAAILVAGGELTKAEAVNHPTSSQLTHFLGMPAPAKPEIYTAKVNRGDRILLCSDGLYGMIDELQIRRIMRSSTSARRICNRLIDTANTNGGNDNIAAVYMKINA